MKRILLLTGNPGIGKTTVLTRVADSLAAYGFGVGGMISREARQNGVRIGFEILDLISRKRGWLAHVNQESGPQIGKYHVNLQDLEEIGSRSITNAVMDCDVIAIDEIGPMELFSNEFRKAVDAALSSRKLVIAVVHWKATDRLVVNVKTREDTELFALTQDNREELINVITTRAMEYLKRT